MYLGGRVEREDLSRRFHIEPSMTRAINCARLRSNASALPDLREP
jgi:hypothetical protein